MARYTVFLMMHISQSPVEHWIRVLCNLAEFCDPVGFTFTEVHRVQLPSLGSSAFFDDDDLHPIKLPGPSTWFTFRTGKYRPVRFTQPHPPAMRIYKHHDSVDMSRCGISWFEQIIKGEIIVWCLNRRGIQALEVSKLVVDFLPILTWETSSVFI